MGQRPAWPPCTPPLMPSANGSKGPPPPPPPPPPPKAKASAQKTGAIDKFVQRDVRVTDTRKTSFRPPHALRDHYEQLISAHGRAKAVAMACPADVPVALDSSFECLSSDKQHTLDRPQCKLCLAIKEGGDRRLFALTTAKCCTICARRWDWWSVRALATGARDR